MSEPDFDGPAQCRQSLICRVAGNCAPARIPLCWRVTEAHGELLDLCGEMEGIADSLPFGIERLRCLRVANELVPHVRRAHRLEEEELFPAFEQSAGTEGRATVRRLWAEHVHDENSADTLTEILLEIGHGGGVVNAEALGYMLRAFFDAVRRHIAFEQEHILAHSPPLMAALGRRS